MESMMGLYRILIGLSALTLLAGLILQLRTKKINPPYRKFLNLLGIVNLLSMSSLLFNLKIPEASGWKEIVILFESIVLSLNLLLAFFVMRSLRNKELSFASLFKRLFFLTFISTLSYATAFLIFGGKDGLLAKGNMSFNIVFAISLGIYSIGSVLPMLISLQWFLRRKSTKRELNLLVVLNGINNTVGLVFYIQSFPSKKVALMLNIISNLLFAYYLAYYFLSSFFENRKLEQIEKEKAGRPYSWNELKSKLIHWEETKNYLSTIYPDLIEEVDLLELSSLEKTHYVLKKLNIKAKDVADALNVSTKAVEMSRYRIGKKVN